MDIASTQRLESGLIERRFTVAGAGGRPVPGVLWTRDGTSGRTPLVLCGHGGGGSKDAPLNIVRRDYFTGHSGIATAAIDAIAHGDRGGTSGGDDPAYVAMWRTPNVIDDMNTDWAHTLDALLEVGEFDPQAIGYSGLSMGTMFGLPYVASEPRIMAAGLGLCGLRGPAMVRSGVAGRLAADAPKVTCPVLYHMQWDDELMDRDSAFELYGLIGSPDKRLQSTPGLHTGWSTEARETMHSFLASRLLERSVPA